MISKINKDIFCLIELMNPNNISFLNNRTKKKQWWILFYKRRINFDATALFAAGEVIIQL